MYKSHPTSLQGSLSLTTSSKIKALQSSGTLPLLMELAGFFEEPTQVMGTFCLTTCTSGPRTRRRPLSILTSGENGSPGQSLPAVLDEFAHPSNPAFPALPLAPGGPAGVRRQTDHLAGPHQCQRPGHAIQEREQVTLRSGASAGC